MRREKTDQTKRHEFYCYQLHPGSLFTMGRKSEVSDAEEGIGTTPAKPSGRPDYDELIKRISVIAQPLASRKLTKRLYRTVKKGIKQTDMIYPVFPVCLKACIYIFSVCLSTSEC